VASRRVGGGWCRRACDELFELGAGEAFVADQGLAWLEDTLE